VRSSEDQHLRRAIALSQEARERGNRPFGAVIADAAGSVLAEAYADSTTTGDCTGHAEVNALRLLKGKVGRETMAGSTMYASGEPCVMCAGAIFWSNIRRVVYGVDHATLRRFRGGRDDQMELSLTCRDIFRAAPHPIEVIGPHLESEAMVPHEGFWK
jgi:tRNA(adenine34) deaminase